MATYNGEDFVAEQLRSILDQLGPKDEVIVVDDASRDDTLAVVTSLADPRIKVVSLPENVGHVRAFERAIAESHGRFVLLADQDDLWAEGRLGVMLEALEDAAMVAGNFKTFGHGAAGPSRLLSASGERPGLRDVAALMAGRRPYYGCCMAFRRDLLNAILPIPEQVTAHDHWLAFVGLLAGEMVHVETVVTLRRIHGGNLTRRRSRAEQISTRVHQLRLARMARVRVRDR